MTSPNDRNRLCHCGCGEALQARKGTKRPDNFRKGHLKRMVDKHAPYFCACGCDQDLKRGYRHADNDFVKYLPNHRRRREITNESGLCLCGCGAEVGYYVDFSHGHNRKLDMQKKREQTGVLKLYKGHESPCWIPTDSPSDDVYGPYRSYHEKRFGLALPGYDRHHLCEVKACVNPDHILLVRPSMHKLLHLGKAVVLPGGKVAVKNSVRLDREAAQDLKKCYERGCNKTEVSEFYRVPYKVVDAVIGGSYDGGKVMVA